MWREVFEFFLGIEEDIRGTRERLQQHHNNINNNNNNNNNNNSKSVSR